MRSYICGVASAFFMSVSVATLAASFVTFPRTVLADEPLYSVKCAGCPPSPPCVSPPPTGMCVGSLNAICEDGYPCEDCGGAAPRRDRVLLPD